MSFLGGFVSENSPVQVYTHDGLGFHQLQLPSGFIGKQIISLTPAQGDPESPHPDVESPNKLPISLKPTVRTLHQPVSGL
ncbi:hypothetical protein JCM16138_23710 [Thermococcus atlanticus]